MFNLAPVSTAPPPSSPAPVVSNQLIDSLPSKQRRDFIAHCKVVDLTFGDVLYEANQQFRDAYFPLTSFISLITTLDSNKSLEMGLIGNEGVLGSTLVLDVDTVPLRAVVQGAGTALRISVTQLRNQLNTSPQLQRVLKRYLYVLVLQLSQSAACLRFHSIEQRLARWLLMTHDRAHADHFHLTHVFLADMLGVRRSGITAAAGVFQDKQFIHYVRGDIQILNRAGLEAAACECYQAVREDYARLL